jgi:hypothetical protein
VAWVRWDGLEQWGGSGGRLLTWGAAPGSDALAVSVGFSPLQGRGGGRAGLPAAAATADGAGAAPPWAYGARPLPRGVWTHLAVVWSAQGVAFHMDGTLVSLQGSATGVPPLGLGPLPRPSRVLGPLEGGLADLQLYFAPLTDLYPLYAGCSCGAAAPSSPPPPPAPGPAAPPWPPAPPTPDALRPLLGALHGWLPLAGSVLSWTPGACILPLPSHRTFAAAPPQVAIRRSAAG